MNDEELVSDLATKINRGEITFDKVRPTLQERGFEEERIRQIVRRVDDEVQKAMLSGNASSTVQLVVRLGIVLLGIGGILLFGSITQLFSLGGQAGTILTYGSLITGLVLLVSGIRRKSKHDSNSGMETLNRKFRIRKDDGQDVS